LYWRGGGSTLLSPFDEAASVSTEPQGNSDPLPSPSFLRTEEVAADECSKSDLTVEEPEADVIKLTWLNIRGARSKDELLVGTATEQRWPLVLLTETKLKREQERLFGGARNEYTWILGAGQKLARNSAPGKGGVGALVHASIRSSVRKLDSTREQLWLQLDPSPSNDARPRGSDQRERPTFIGVVYLPTGSSASAEAERQRTYEELALRVQRYQSQGTVLLGGDMNARLSANGDPITNTAGVRLQEFAHRNGLLIGNTPNCRRSPVNRSHVASARTPERSYGTMVFSNRRSTMYSSRSQPSRGCARSLWWNQSRSACSATTSHWWSNGTTHPRPVLPVGMTMCLLSRQRVYAGESRTLLPIGVLKHACRED
jgi:hypothetical protein